jgi:dCTP diphosphatase
MSKGDAETTLQELKDLMLEFREARGWNKDMSPKNMAISICLEAAELLEHFQWDEYKSEDEQEIIDEFADVIMNCMSFANASGIDVSSAMKDKLERAKIKYPTEIFNPGSDSKEAYFQVKKAYRAKKGKP